MPKAPRLNLAQKQAIVGAHLLGLTYPQIAKQCHVGNRSVQRVVQDYKAQIEAKATKELADELGTYKDKLKDLSIKTLVLALSPTENGYDKYKAAAIATSTLKGIGEWRDDVIQVGVSIQIDGSRLAGRYNRIQAGDTRKAIDVSTADATDKGDCGAD
jgi:hypothetical protein